MRFSRLLLGLSLAANLGLAYLWYAQPKGSMNDGSTWAPELELAGVEAAPVAPVAATATRAFSPEMTQALPAFFRQLTDGDFRAEIARLRASGLPEETVSLIGQLIIAEKFKQSYEAFAGRGFSPDILWGGMSALTDVQREAR